jgi:hypothetical protein
LTATNSLIVEGNFGIAKTLLRRKQANFWRSTPTQLCGVTTPDALRLKIEPAADCGRYDGIRKIA